MLAISSSLQPQPFFNGSLSFASSNPQFRHRSTTIFRWRFGRDQESSLSNLGQSQFKGDPGNEVLMVDPLEAKRLAAKQMEKIKAKEKAKRRREIEAINGAWAMIGLTAGLVIEGQTGNGILAQLAGYISAIVHIFVR